MATLPFNASTPSNFLMFLLSLAENASHAPTDMATEAFQNVTITKMATEANAASSPPVTVADDKDDITAESTLWLIETVVNVGILPVLVLCGVTGNAINMAVFVRQGLGDRFNLCLFSLALSDTGFIVFHLTSRTFVILNLFDTKLGEYWQARALSLTGVYLSFLLTSDLLTLIIALQRCIVVISPLSANKLPKTKVMTVIVLSLCAACFSGTGAYSFRWTPGTITDPVTNVTRDVIMDSEFYFRNVWLFHVVVEVVFNVGVPLTSLFGVVVSNVIIAVRMRSVLAWRKDKAHVGSSQMTSFSSSLASANQRETAMTKMLLVVCLVYSICTTPTAVQACARFLVPELSANGRYRNTFYAGLCISHLLETVNCSANFLIYFTMSSKFNETLREMFCLRYNNKEKETEEKLDQRRISTTVCSSLDC